MGLIPFAPPNFIIVKELLEFWHKGVLGYSLQTSSLIAALISFVIGTLCLFSLALINGDLNISLIKSLPKQDLWKFLGGILGAFFVFGTILLAPKVGLSNIFLLVLVGQVIMGLLLDNFGAFGLPPKPISWYKILGLVIVLSGLFVFFLKNFALRF